MRIVVATPVDVRGLARWLDRPTTLRGLGSTAVTSILRRLLERGHDLTVATLDPEIAAGEERVLEGPRLRIRVGPYRPQHRARDAFAVERRAIEAAVRREAAPIVHAHWSYEFALGALAAAPGALVSFHDWSPRIVRLNPHPYRLVRLGLQARTLLRARHLTAVSPAISERMQRYTRRPIAVVPNGIEEDRFRADLPEFSDPAVLLSVATGFSTWKNVATLVRAFPKIRSVLPGSRLLLVGRDFESGGTAQRWALEEGVPTAGIEFIGALPQDEVLDAMRRAHVLVHPSLEEACPMVVIEAMAQGLPVVGGSASGGVPWTLGDGRCGVLTDVSSPEVLARDTASLLGDQERWARLSHSARERAWSTFRMDAVVDRYEVLYGQLAGAGAGQ